MADWKALERSSGGVERSTVRESALVWLIGERYGDSVAAASKRSTIS